MADDGTKVSPTGVSDKVQQRLQQMRQRSLRDLRRAAANGFKRLCPLCGYEGLFAPVGIPPRLDALCPACGSRERHRLLKLCLDRESLVKPTDVLLHFAPEPQLSATLRKLAKQYVTADLMREKMDRTLNVEDMDLPDESFDVIVANHILEHVDHRKALAECFRCLTPGGRLLLTTPVIDAWEKTHENAGIVDPRERLLHFGQADHIRFFGRDLKDHMRQAGFLLTEHVSVEPDVARYGLWRGETLFVLTKPAHRPAARAKARKG